jgi:hypothetical protein
LVDGRRGLVRSLVEVTHVADGRGSWISRAPQIVVTIGRESRIYSAFVTSAPSSCDAPATVTLYVSDWRDVAGFAADELSIDQGARRTAGRIVLVDALECDWQEAQCEEAGHILAPADDRLVGFAALQRWLWRRLLAIPHDEGRSHGTDPGSR